MQNIDSSTVIAIAGTVGVGKSTLTKKLAEKLNLRTSFEKVDDNPYLDKYYKDFKRWGFHLQTFFLAERFKAQKKMFEYGGGFVQDRTIYEDLEIFAKMNHDNQTMSDEDYKTYQELFSAMVYSPYFNPPDIVIYIEGDIEQILQRINERGRQMEIDTDETYWRNLYDRYLNWIDTYTESPLLRVNINDYDVEDEKSIDLIIDKIDSILDEYKKTQQK